MYIYMYMVHGTYPCRLQPLTGMYLYLCMCSIYLYFMHVMVGRTTCIKVHTGRVTCCLSTHCLGQKRCKQRRAWRWCPALFASAWNVLGCPAPTLSFLAGMYACMYAIVHTHYGRDAILVLKRTRTKINKKMDVSAK